MSKRVGPLQAQNVLAEIAEAGTDVQAAARANLGAGTLAALSALAGLDASQTNVLATGQSTPFGLGARFADRVDLRAYLPAANGDFGAALQAAANDVPATGGMIYIAPGQYTSSTPAVITADKDICLFCHGRGQAVITANHTGIPITINQDTSGRITHVRGLTFFGGAGATGPIAAPVKIAYGPTAAPDVPQEVVIEDVDVFPFLGGAGFSAPYPGSWQAGIILQGAGTGLSGMLGQVRINRYNFQGGLVAAPAPLSGSAGLVIGRVDDIRLTDCSFWYADTAILQSDYCEGLRLDGVTTVGTNHFLTQGAGATAQNGILLQKLWLDDFEINTYHTALPLKEVSNAYIGAGEVIRYADSGANDWLGFDLQDCFSWQSAGALTIDGLAGTQTGSIGIRCTTTQQSGEFNALHVFANTYFIRLDTAVDLESGVAFCRFVNLYSFGAAGPLSNFTDNSGNATNVITWRGFGGQVQTTLASHQFAASDGSIGFSVANVPGTVNSLAAVPGTTGNPASLEAAGADTSIPMSYVAKGEGGHQFSNGNGTMLTLAVEGTGALRGSLLVYAPIAGEPVILTAAGAANDAIPLQLQAPNGANVVVVAPQFLTLPTSPTGLAAGTVWNNGGVLCVV